jgi:hypothetical protein
MTRDDQIKEAIAQFPETFGLRGHNGDFTLSARSSYVGSDGIVWLYTRKDGQDFCKGTVDELRREVIAGGRMTKGASR